MYPVTTQLPYLDSRAIGVMNHDRRKATIHRVWPPHLFTILVYQASCNDTSGSESINVSIDSFVFVILVL